MPECAPPPAVFGFTLQDLRKACDETIFTQARRLGVSCAEVSDIQRGKLAISEVLAARMIDAYALDRAATHEILMRKLLTFEERAAEDRDALRQLFHRETPGGDFFALFHLLKHEGGARHLARLPLMCIEEAALYFSPKDEARLHRVAHALRNRLEPEWRVRPFIQAKKWDSQIAEALARTAVEVVQSRGAGSFARIYTALEALFLVHSFGPPDAAPEIFRRWRASAPAELFQPFAAGEGWIPF